MLQAGHGFCKGFQYCLYSVVKTLVLDIRKVVVVLLEYTEQVIIENRNGNLCIGFLLDKRNDAHTIVKSNILCRYTGIIRETLAGITTYKEDITHTVVLSLKLHII